MARMAFSDEAMMMLLLRSVVAASEGKEPTTQPPEPDPCLCEMERAGLLWLLPRKHGEYLIVPTDDGIREVRSWQHRRAKEAARHFGSAA